MSIRHRTPLLAGLAFAGLVALLAFAFGTASQAKPVTPVSVAGTYGFLMTELRVLDPGNPTSAIEYCDVSGEIEFEPADAEATITLELRRCLDHNFTFGIHNAGLDTGLVSHFDYTVDGTEIVLTEQEGDGSQTHGRILLKGSLLLFDGTFFPLDGGHLVSHGVAAKL